MRSGRGASEPSVPRRTDKRLEEKKTKADEEKKGQQGGRRASSQVLRPSLPGRVVATGAVQVGPRSCAPYPCTARIRRTSAHTLREEA